MQEPATNHDAERPPAANRLTESSRDQSASQQLGEAGRETRRLGERHTVKEAAEVLGTTVDAVRGRIRRGTLNSVKLDGAVYVLLDATNRKHQSDQSDSDGSDGRQEPGAQAGLVADQSELVGELRDQIDWLRREVERKDTIIMSLTQRIPELEAAPEPRESSQTPLKDQGNGAANPADGGTEKPSWWRRFFGFEA